MGLEREKEEKEKIDFLLFQEHFKFHSEEKLRGGGEGSNQKEIAWEEDKGEFQGLFYP